MCMYVGVCKCVQSEREREREREIVGQVNIVRHYKRSFYKRSIRD